MYPENLEGTQVIVGSMNMGYVSDTARIQSRNLFRPKCAPIPLGYNDRHPVSGQESGIWLDPVSCTKRYPVLSRILYPVLNPVLSGYITNCRLTLLPPIMAFNITC